MKTIITWFSTLPLRLGLLSLAAFILAVPPARAGLSVIMEVAHELDSAYPPAIYTNYQILLWGVAADANLPAAPLGGYVISSPSGAISEGFQLTSGGASDFTGSDGADFPDYLSFVQELTNGNWTITFTNATTTNLYTFTVSAPGFTSGSLPDVNILFPSAGAINVTNNPLFTWQGLPAWGGSDIQVEDYNTESGFWEENFLATSQTNWTSPAILPDGPNSFSVDYVGSLSSSVIVASTPRDSLSHPISSWDFRAFLDTYAWTSFTVANYSTGNPSLTPLVAHYTFDDGSLAATDSSGNGNNLSAYFDDSGGSIALTNDALEGPYAAAFAPQYAYSGGDYYTDNTNLLNALAGSFSVSLWLKTTQVSGSDTDAGIYSDAGIVSALAWDHISNTNFVLPMMLTGHKLAFVTVGGGGTAQDTLHSATSVNTGGYVHVVVTRNQATGEKRIYVNGSLDASDFSTTDLLNGSAFLQIGMNNGQGFNGILDDLQFYSTPLSDSQVLRLYQHPGTTAYSAPVALNVALNATNLTWTTGGNANWVGETDTTHDGVVAAQSGGITDSQTTWLQTTVPANGQVSFYWKVSSEQDFDYLTFYINGVQQAAISGEVDWNQETYPVFAGDSLRWEYSKDDSNSEGQDAGWVDQVQYTTNFVSGGPVSASFDLQLENYQYQDFTYNFNYFEATPYITGISPAPVTTNLIVSPDGYMFSEVWAGDSYQDNSSGEGFNTLDELIYACTNGLWTLYVNKGDPSQQVFHFSVSISGLTTNLLAPVTVLVPAPTAVNVPTNSPLQWSGPANYSSISVEAYQYYPSFAFDGYTNLPASTTNWPSPPTLLYGTNYFYVSYSSNNFPGVTFTTPVDAGLNPISTWSTEADLYSDTFESFVVGAPAPLPVQLTGSPALAGGGNFQLGFQTLAGRLETIQVRTNLMGGVWMDVTNFIGDGAVHEFTFPTTNAPGGYFRVITQ